METGGRARKHFIILKSSTEPYSSRKDECEADIGRHTKWARHIKQQFRVLELVYGYLNTYVAALQWYTTRKDSEKKILEEVMRVRLDISDPMDLYFYGTVKFYRASYYPTNVESFGKWIRPSKNVCLILCYVIIKANRETANL